MNLVSNHPYNHKKAYLSLLLFLLIFCILGLPFTDWGFRCDDWGNIWHSAIRKWQDVPSFFTDGRSLDDFHYPSGYTTIKPSFFCGLYRPMSLVYLIPQYFLFTTHAYGYFLTTIAIHACSSVLLFHLFSLFTNLTTAFVAALFFGFHPSQWTWIGWISAQTYNIELLILLVIILLLKLYVDNKKMWAYFIVCLLHCSNIFLHEQTFFLPIWLLFALPVYDKQIINRSISYAKSIKTAILTALPLLAISLFYMLVRLHYFPLTVNTATLTFQPTWQSFKTRMIERVYDFVTFIVDIIGLTAIPKNNPLFKLSLIVIIFFILVWLFVKSNKKVIALFLAFSIPLFGWPALLMHNQTRYYYIALPLFIALVIILLPLQKLTHLSKKITFVFFVSLTLINAHFLFRDLKKREVLYHPVTKAFEQLVNNKTTANRSICFVGLPQETHLFGACAQAVWLLRGNENQPVFSIGKKPLPKDFQKYNPIYVEWDSIKQQFIF